MKALTLTLRRMEQDQMEENMISLETSSDELNINSSKVETISKNLLERSEKNEVLLKKLPNQNVEVSASSQNLQKVSIELLTCVDEIGIALDVISNFEKQNDTFPKTFDSIKQMMEVTD